MPIKGLTDRGASFPRIGELRKGGEKPAGNKPGPDLKHFRFTSQHPEVLESFTARYGTHPTAVNVYLPFATAAENFEAWIEEWGAGSLKWRGDGETLVVWQKPDGTYSREPKPQPAGGKQSGRLKIIIPELGRLAYVTALTTAVNDIMEMQSTLDAYEALRGDLRGIPFVLSRVPRMVSTPGQGGQRVRREKWLWHLEAQPVWVQAQLSVMQRDALPGGRIVEGQYQLGAGAVDLDTGEIFDDDDESAQPVKQQAQPAAPLIVGANPDGTMPARSAEDTRAEILAGVNFDDKRPASEAQLKFVRSALSALCNGDNGKAKTVIGYLFQLDSSTKLTNSQARALIDWSGSTKENGYTVNPVSAQEAERMVVAAYRGEGQAALFEDAENGAYQE